MCTEMVWPAPQAVLLDSGNQERTVSHLSSLQEHYDFGMRALKAVLMMAGGLKRVCKQDPEAVVVIRALRDANLPKLLTDVSAGDWTVFVGRAVALLSLQGLWALADQPSCTSL